MVKNIQIQDPAAWIEKMIRKFIHESPDNTLKNKQNDKAWEDPLVGFFGGADPIYQTYKEVVGPFHWTPEEIFRKTFPGSNATAEQLTVISWILPQSELTKADNRRETEYPSERWARARRFGEEGNIQLLKHVVAVLLESGHDACCPCAFPGLFKKAVRTVCFFFPPGPSGMRPMPPAWDFWSL